MQTYEAPLFTPAEAAVLTRLPLKTVNNAIDRKAISVSNAARSGSAGRLLDFHALLALALERRLADRFAPELRRALFDALAGGARDSVSLEGGFLTIDLRELRGQLAGSLRELRRARRIVISDPEIMGGDPVFHGTRIPVHLIATLLGQGSTATELQEGYPHLTAEMARLAPIYAAAYPLRGRPRAQPWRDQPPVSRTRRSLTALEAE
jgi:uncharacterized protein (DUF433 family)